MGTYKLVDVITAVYPIIRRKFIGSTNTQVIKNNSESIEDQFHNQLETLIGLFPDHESATYDEEYNFIMTKIHQRLKVVKRIKKTTLYLDDMEYMAHDYEDGFNEFGENVTIDSIPDVIDYSNVDAAMDNFYEKLEILMTTNTTLTHANN